MDIKSELPVDVLEAIHTNRKIEAIKRLRAYSRLGLKEAKEIIDAYIEEHPDRIIKHPSEASGFGRIVLIAVVIAVLYSTCRLFT